MEDIEYLEEFKDMVQTSIAPSLARNPNDAKAHGKGRLLPSKVNYSDVEDSSSSDIDLDIFEKLFNNESDGDIPKNSDKKKHKPKPINNSKTNVRGGPPTFSSSDYDSDDSVYNKLHIDKSKNRKGRSNLRDSMDSIDALVQDFGECIPDRGRKLQPASRTTASVTKKSVGGSTTTASSSKSKPIKTALSAIKGRPPISSSKKPILQPATSTSTPKTTVNKTIMAEKLVRSGQKSTLASKTHKPTMTTKQQTTSQKLATTHKLTSTQKPTIKAQKSFTMTQKAITNPKSATKTSITSKQTQLHHAKHSSQILATATTSSSKSASPIRGNSNIPGRRTFLDAKDLATPKQPDPSKDPLNLDENDYKDDADDTDEDDFLSLPDDDDDDGGLSGIDSDSFDSSDYTHDSDDDDEDDDDELVIDISTDSNFSGARSELRSTPPPNVSDSDETTSDKCNERLQKFLEDIRVYSKCKTLKRHGSDCSLDSIERSLEAKFTSPSKGNSKCDLTKDTTDNSISVIETNENTNIKLPQPTDDKQTTTVVVIEECVAVETNEKQVTTTTIDVEKDNKTEQNQQTVTVSVENPTPTKNPLNNIKSSTKPTAESTPLLTSSSRSLTTTNKPTSTHQKDLSEVHTLSINRKLYKDNNDTTESAKDQQIENVMDDFDESITLEQIEQSSLELQKQIMEMDNDLELSLDFNRRHSFNSRCNSLKGSYIKSAKNSPQNVQTSQPRARGRPKKNRAKTTDEPKSVLIEKTVKIRTVSDSALSNLKHRCFDINSLTPTKSENSNETESENNVKAGPMTDNANELDVASKVQSKTVETIVASQTNNATDTSVGADAIEGQDQLAAGKEREVQQKEGTSTNTENLSTTAKDVASSISDNIAQKPAQCDIVNEKAIVKNVDLLIDEDGKEAAVKETSNIDQSSTDSIRKEKLLHTQHKSISETPKRDLHKGEEQTTQNSTADLDGAAVCKKDTKSNEKSQLPTESLIEETCIAKSEKEIVNKSVLQNHKDMTLLKEDNDERLTESNEPKESIFQIPREIKSNEISYKSRSMEGSTTPKRESSDDVSQIRDLNSSRSISSDSADNRSRHSTSKKHKEKRNKSSSKERDRSHEKRKSKKKDRSRDHSKLSSKATESGSSSKIVESPKKDKNDEKREPKHDSSHKKEKYHSKDHRKSHKKDYERKTSDKKDTETKKKDVTDPKTELKSISENERREDKRKTKENEKHTEVTVKPSSSKAVESKKEAFNKEHYKHHKKEKKHLKNKDKQSNSRSDNKSSTKLSEEKVREITKPKEIFKEKSVESANKSKVEVECKDEESVIKSKITKEQTLNEKTLNSEIEAVDNLLEISTNSPDVSLVVETVEKGNETKEAITTTSEMEATVISISSANDSVSVSKPEVDVVDKKVETNEKDEILIDQKIIEKRLSTSKEQEVKEDLPKKLLNEIPAKEIKPSVENFVVDQSTNDDSKLTNQQISKSTNATDDNDKKHLELTVTERTQQAVTLTSQNETESSVEIFSANENITNIETTKNSKSHINSEKINMTSEEQKEEVLDKHTAKESVALATPQEELCNRLNATQTNEDIYGSVITDPPLMPSSSKRCEDITVNNSFLAPRETRSTMKREDTTTTTIGTCESPKERTENECNADLTKNLMSTDNRTTILKQSEAKHLDDESTECIVKSGRKKAFIQNTKDSDSPAMKLTRSSTKNLADALEEESQTKELATKTGRKKDLIESTKDRVSPVNTKLTRSVARNLTEELKNEARKCDPKESVGQKDDIERGKERDSSVRKLTRSVAKNLIDGGAKVKLEENDSKESLDTTATKEFTESSTSREVDSTKITRIATRNFVSDIKNELAESGSKDSVAKSCRKKDLSECTKGRDSPATKLTRSAVRNLADSLQKMSAESDSKESTVMCEKDCVGRVQETDLACSMSEENDSKASIAKSIRNKLLPEINKPRVSPVTMLTRSATSNFIDGVQNATDQKKDSERMADDKEILRKSAEETLQKTDQFEKSNAGESPRIKFTRSATRNLTETFKAEIEEGELKDSCAESDIKTNLVGNRRLDSPTTTLTRSAVKNLLENEKLATEKSNAKESGNESGGKNVRSRNSRKGLFDGVNESQNHTDTDTEEEGRCKVTRLNHIDKRKRKMSPEIEPLAKVVRTRRGKKQKEQEASTLLKGNEKETMSVNDMTSSTDIASLANVLLTTDQTKETENVENSQEICSLETCNGELDTATTTKESFNADSKNIDEATSDITTAPATSSTETVETTNVPNVTTTESDSNTQCDTQVQAENVELTNQVTLNDKQLSCENISTETEEHALYEHLPESRTPIDDLLPVYDEDILPCDDMVIEQFIEVEFSQMGNINDETEIRQIADRQEDVDEVANQLADILNTEVINTDSELQENENDLGVEITDEELINGLIDFAMPENVQTTNERINIVDHAALDALLNLEQTEINEKSETTDEVLDNTTAGLSVVVGQVDSEKKQVDNNEILEDNKVIENQDRIDEDKRTSNDEIEKTDISNKVVEESCATLKNLNDLEVATDDNKGNTLETTNAVAQAETTAITEPEEVVLACISKAEEIPILNENYKDSEITKTSTETDSKVETVDMNKQNENTKTSDCDANVEVESEARSLTKTLVDTMEETDEVQVERSPSVTSEYVRKLRIRVKRTIPENIALTKKACSEPANTESIVTTTAIATNVEEKQQAKDGENMLNTSKRSLRKRVAKTTTDENEATRRRLLDNTKVISKQGSDKMMTQKKLVGKATYLDRFEKPSDQTQPSKKLKISSSSSSTITSSIKEKSANAIETKSTTEIKTTRPSVKGNTKLAQVTSKKVVVNPKETSATPIAASRVKKANETQTKTTTDELSKDVKSTSVSNERLMKQTTSTRSDSSTERIVARTNSKERVVATRQLSIAGAKAVLSKSLTNTVANNQEAAAKSTSSNKPLNVSNDRQTSKSVTISSAVGKKIDKVQSNVKTGTSTQIVLINKEQPKVTIGDIVEQPSTSKEFQTSTKSTVAESVTDTSKDVKKYLVIQKNIKKSLSKDTLRDKMKNDETKKIGKKQNTPSESETNEKNVKIQNEAAVEDVVSSTTITTIKTIENAPATTTETVQATTTETVQATTTETVQATTTETVQATTTETVQATTTETVQATTTETVQATTTETVQATEKVPTTTTKTVPTTTETSPATTETETTTTIEIAPTTTTTETLPTTTTEIAPTTTKTSPTTLIEIAPPSTTTKTPPTTIIETKKTTTPTKIQRPVTTSDSATATSGPKTVASKTDTERAQNNNKTKVIVSSTQTQCDQQSSDVNSKPSSVKITTSQREPSKERGRKKNPKTNVISKLLTAQEVTKEQQISSSERENSSVSRDASNERITRRTIKAGNVQKLSSRETSHERFVSSNETEGGDGSSVSGSVGGENGGDKRETSKERVTRRSLRAVSITPTTVRSTRKTSHERGLATKQEETHQITTNITTKVTAKNELASKATSTAEIVVGKTVVKPKAMEIDTIEEESKKSSVETQSKSAKRKATETIIKSINKKPRTDVVNVESEKAVTTAQQAEPVPVTLTASTTMSTQDWSTVINDRKWQPRIRINRRTFHNYSRPRQQQLKTAPIAVAAEHYALIKEHTKNATDKHVNEIANISVADLEQVEGHIETAYQNLSTTNLNVNATLQEKRLTKTLAAAARTTSTTVATTINSSDQIIVDELTCVQPFALIEPKTEVVEEREQMDTTPALSTVANVTSTVSTSSTRNTMQTRSATLTQQPAGSAAKQLTAASTELTPRSINTTTESTNAANTNAYTIGRTCAYSYLHPAKYNQSYGYVQLDYCCPNLNGPMRAIDPTRLHKEINAPVRELPACIVMTTKVVKASEYKKNRDILPEPVRLKLERRNGGVSLASVLAAGGGVVRNQTAALPASSSSSQTVSNVGKIKKIIPTSTASATTMSPYTQTASKKVATRVQRTTATATATTATTSTTTVATPVAVPTAVKVSTIDKLKKQLPTITITPKLRYDATATTTIATPSSILPPVSTVAASNSQLGTTHPVQPAMPLFNVDLLSAGPQTEQRIELQRNVQLFDKLLQNIARRVLTLSLQDRQRTIAAIVGNSRLEPIDFEVGMKLLENYDKWITAVTLPQSTTMTTATGTATLTTQIQTQSTNASTRILNESTGLFEPTSTKGTATALTRPNVSFGKLMTPLMSKQPLRVTAAVSTSFVGKSPATSGASETANVTGTPIAKRSSCKAVAMYDTNNKLIGYQFNAADIKSNKTTATTTTTKSNTDTTMSETVTPTGARIRRGFTLKSSPATTPTVGLQMTKQPGCSNTPQQQLTSTTTSRASIPANTTDISSTSPKPRGRPRVLTKGTNSTFQRPNAKLASGVIMPTTALATSASPATKSTSATSKNVQASPISIATVSSGGSSGAEECILPDAMDTTPLDPSQIKTEQIDEDMII